jgi:transposase
VFVRCFFLRTLPFSLPGFEIQQISCGETALTITACAINSEAICPSCQQVSHRVHSYYTRSSTDLPVSGQRVQLILHVRRFRCQNRQCQRQTFGERLPEVVPVQARRTTRLGTLLDLMAICLSGRAGSRLTAQMGMAVSADTLLRRAKRAGSASSKTPRLLGVDDFAFQRGRTYGTILVDLETHRPIDLLADRSADTLSQWLKSHPGVEVISRDRSTEYRRGATEGAPDAQQVIDRWHLLKNLREALERLLTRLHEGLTTLPTASSEGVAARPRQKRTRAEAAASTASRLRRLARYEQVVQLSQQGASIIGIARQLRISRQTVRKYRQAGTFPEQARAFRTKSRLDPYLPYLQQRWQQGCRSANTLWQELLARGFSGGYMLVYRWIQMQREVGEALQVSSLPTSSSVRAGQRSLEAPRHLAWLLVNDPTRLEKPARDTLWFLRQHAEVNRAYDLAQQLLTMVKERNAAPLERWFLLCSESGVSEVENFARGLQKEASALRAALTLEYSNGPVEGQITKLKLIKRSMYGRGSFTLLRQRVLKAA